LGGISSRIANNTKRCYYIITTPRKGTDMQFSVGDVIQARKMHPCGSFHWEIMRTGIDFRIRCLGCNRVIMLPRRKFEGMVKKVISSSYDEEA